MDTAAGNEPVAAPPTPEEIADKFPQFEVVECLGRGGMGVVYKARQKSLDRWVAIKVLAPERVHEERFAEHFEREAKTLAKMSHPNIVTVFDHGQTDGLFYIVMEFVDGLNLRDLLREAKMEPEQALAIIPPICDALEYAHDKGVVHRDIKPENILLDREGRVKIADFGIASLVGVSGEKTGTPPYMAPEQENGIVDRRADIYALGAVLYEMLTGERPNKEIVAPSKKVQIDVRLDEIVLRALEKTPELRYQTAGEFRTVVETVAAPPAKSEVRSQEPEQIENLRKSANPPLLRGCVDYRSKTTLFGLPLLHVTSGVDPLTGRVLVAKGIIAIGDRAQGVVAFGGVAAGGLAFGGVAMGVIAFGGCAVGLVSFGGLAIAPIVIGGGACGYLAFGGKGIGAHVLDPMTNDPVAEQFFLPWAKTLLVNINWILMPVLLPVVGIGVGVPLWFQRRAINRSVANDTGSAGGVPARPGNGSSSVSSQSSINAEWNNPRGAFALLVTIAAIIVALVLAIPRPEHSSKSAHVSAIPAIPAKSASLYMPPVAIRTVPESGVKEVDSSLTELRVTFSKPMKDGSWSWCRLDDETFPEMTGAPRYLDGLRTCVLPVKLQPGRTYATWINVDQFQGFRDQSDQPAVPYLLIFETRK
jgi:tRNA A-37 threonylcarbamoyl transferase component Bud32